MQPQPQPPKKIVLAYSGGLDTSVILPWLKERYPGVKLVAFAAELGQGNELKGIEDALSCSMRRHTGENGELGGLLERPASRAGTVQLPRRDTEERHADSEADGPSPPIDTGCPGSHRSRTGRREHAADWDEGRKKAPLPHPVAVGFPDEDNTGPDEGERQRRLPACDRVEQTQGSTNSRQQNPGRIRLAETGEVVAGSKVPIALREKGVGEPGGEVPAPEDQVAAEAMADNDELLIDRLAGHIKNIGARISFRLQNQLPNPIEYIRSKRAQGQDSIGESPVHKSGF